MFKNKLILAAALLSISLVQQCTKVEKNEKPEVIVVTKERFVAEDESAALVSQFREEDARYLEVKRNNKTIKANYVKDSAGMSLFKTDDIIMKLSADSLTIEQAGMIIKLKKAGK